MNYLVAVREAGPEEQMRYLGPLRSLDRARYVAKSLNEAFTEASEDDPDSTALAYVVELHSASLQAGIEDALAWALGASRG